MNSGRTSFANLLVRWSVPLGVLVLLTTAVWAPLRMKRPATETGLKQEHAGLKTQSYKPPADDQYVGSDSCADCHRAIAETYKLHPMAHSISTVDPDSAESRIEGELATVIGQKHSWLAEMRNGQLIHHDRMLDDAGSVIYDQGIAMNYVVGSGKRAKAYMYQQDQVLFMSPLNWYTQPGRWDMAPGYTPADPRRFDRRITDECLSCHAGRVAAVGRSLNAYRQPPFHEMAIGCENCHGPGQRHVALRSSGTPVDSAADPIVNPSRLKPSQRESVCNQCHLQAAVRLTRNGRSDLDFRPGQDLDEVWTVLDMKRPITADGRTHSVNHVQQMRESRCYQKSGGRFGCTSCHEPHSVPKASDSGAFYRSRCLKCHDQTSCSETQSRRDDQQDACASCHMPARKSSNISHVTQTDHRVIRKLASAAEAVDDESDQLAFFDDQNQRLDPVERDRALGLAAWARLTKTGRRPPKDLALFLDRVLQKTPDDALLLTALGAMAQQGNRLDLARDYYERAAKFPAGEEAAVAGLLEVYYAAADWPNALRCADRLLEINPRETKAQTLKADILALNGKVHEGIDSARKALELNPTLVPLRKWLVKAYRSLDRNDDAEHEAAILRRMESSP